MKRDYSQENQLGFLEAILLGLGTLAAAGIIYVVYKSYESSQAYQATLPPGAMATQAGYDAWLQTPVGQATL